MNWSDSPTCLHQSTHKPIGGFFELELPRQATYPAGYHPDALALTSGRACLKAILAATRPSKIFLPFYTCQSVVNTVRLLNIPFEWYALNETLAPETLPPIEPGALFLYINYAGLQTQTVDRLWQHIGQALVLDNTQAFFDIPPPGCWAFYSPRKFFGVPDGGYLYSPYTLSRPTKQQTHVSYAHLLERRLGNQEIAYQSYLENESRISDDYLSMSLLSEILLSHVDYPMVQARRRENFQHYHQALALLNQLDLSHVNLDMATPFCYPFLPGNPIDKRLLWEQHIFVPTYWPNVLEQAETGFSFERQLSQHALFLPVDHRYDIVDCEHIIRSITALL